MHYTHHVRTRMQLHFPLSFLFLHYTSIISRLYDVTIFSILFVRLRIVAWIHLQNNNRISQEKM